MKSAPSVASLNGEPIPEKENEVLKLLPGLPQRLVRLLVAAELGNKASTDYKGLYSPEVGVCEVGQGGLGKEFKDALGIMAFCAGSSLDENGKDFNLSPRDVLFGKAVGKARGIRERLKSIM